MRDSQTLCQLNDLVNHFPIHDILKYRSLVYAMGTLIKEADSQNPFFYSNLCISVKKKIQNKNIFQPTYPNFFNL